MTDPRETWTPPKLGAKEFERLVQHRADSMHRAGLLRLRRNGVKASIVNDGLQTRTVVSKSLPDFGGALAPHGRSLSVECKVCSTASFTLTAAHNNFHAHQYRDLVENERMGGLSFLLIHFNLLVLKKKTHEEFTVGIRVDPDMMLWRGFEVGTIKTVNRDTAKAVGIVVPWGYATPRVQTLTPELGVLFQGDARDGAA